MGSERKIRYAVVGAGNIAQEAVLPAFAHATGTSELVAIVSGDSEKRAALAKRYERGLSNRTSARWASKKRRTHLHQA